MAFPTSPTNGQIASVNGINYTYVAASNSWSRVASTGNYIAGTAPPTTGNIVGATWYNTTTDVFYEFVYDGANYYWVDVSTAAFGAPIAGNLSTVNLVVSGTTTNSGNITFGANANVTIDASSRTDGINFPAGTTAQRQSSPLPGQHRFNTTIGTAEYWNGNTWVAYGTVSTPTVNYLIVAGGGGGATDIDVGGGGGAGGLLQGTTSVSNLQTYTIVIGNGGAQGTGPDNTGTGGGTNGTQGGSSSAFGLTAIGGGYGGTRGQYGGSGGSGGGSGDIPGSATGGAGTSGQGYNGGTAPPVNSNGGWDEGGGGGAGGAATNGTSGAPSYPGPGVASYITGANVVYAAGGRGAQLVVGAANTGNGGSGCRNGGSGVVIISYPQTYRTATTTGNVTQTTTANGYVVYSFTSSGTISF
jgi:hypothetical protein